MAKRSYEKSFQELEKIVQAIESGEVGLDELEKKVKRASVLIEACRMQLRNTEQEISDMMENLDT